MVPAARLGRATPGLEGPCSVQLSYAGSPAESEGVGPHGVTHAPGSGRAQHRCWFTLQSSRGSELNRRIAELQSAAFPDLATATEWLTGLEPAAPALGTRRSTIELQPHSAGGENRTREVDLGKIVPYHWATPACARSETRTRVVLVGNQVPYLSAILAQSQRRGSNPNLSRTEGVLDL